MKSKNIGFEISAPKKECEDKKCPFHGNLKVRGRLFAGTVVSKDVHNTVTVEWIRRKFMKKYERFEKRKSRIRAHNPPCINAQVGDSVQIYECKPLSKTKNTVVVKIIGEDIKYKQKQEIIEEDREIVEKSRGRKEEEETKPKESEEKEE